MTPGMGVDGLTGIPNYITIYLSRGGTEDLTPGRGCEEEADEICRMPDWACGDIPQEIVTSEIDQDCGRLTIDGHLWPPCACFATGWTAGKIKAHFETREMTAGHAVATCGCDPCVTARAVLEREAHREPAGAPGPVEQLGYLLTAVELHLDRMIGDLGEPDEGGGEKGIERGLRDNSGLTSTTKREGTMAVYNKIHLSAWEPHLIAGPGGEWKSLSVCNRYDRPDRVATREMYETWVGGSMTPEIFCGNCVKAHERGM